MFTHLHSHTDYSLLDGLTKVKDYVRKVKELGMTACAITDHGTAAGLVDFYDECKAQGIKPILGCEVYEAPQSRFDRKQSEEGDSYHHLVLLVKNEQGYKNLCKLVTRSNTEGFYYKPRIDLDLLEECHEGLICLSACVSGRVPKALIRGQHERVPQLIEKYHKIFGDDYYLEIQNHGLKDEKTVAALLPMYAKKFGIKVIATNDCHYVNTDDAEAHEWLLCLQTGKKLTDPTHMRYEGDYSVKSEAEMLRLFPDCPEAIYNTQEIVDKCNFEFKYGEYRMPKVVIPEEFGDDYFGYLESEAWKGFEERYPEGYEKRKEAEEDLKYELSVIKNMGFSEYFLDIRKTIVSAKDQDILVGPGRGCQVKGGLVYTDNGIKNIEDVKIGDIVYNCEGTPCPVKQTFEYDIEEPLLKVQTWLGGKVSFTKDHKFLTVPCEIKGKNKSGFLYADKIPQGSPIWLKARNLKVGDWLVMPIPKVEENQTIFDLAKYVKTNKFNISDEYIFKKDFSGLQKLGVSFKDVSKATGLKVETIGNFYFKRSNARKDTENKISSFLIKKGLNIEEWRDLISEKRIKRFVPLDENLGYVLGYYIADGSASAKQVNFIYNIETEKEYGDILRKRLVKCFGSDLSISERIAKKCGLIIVNSSIVRNFIKDLISGISHTKRVSSAIFTSNINTRKGFLNGIFDGDGTYRKERTIYSSVNKNLIFDVKFLLYMFGIPSTVNEITRNETREKYGIRTYQTYCLSLPSTVNTLNVLDRATPTSRYPDRHCYVDENYIYTRIKTIEEFDYKGKVYDLSVDTAAEPSYCTAFSAVHNSGAGSRLNYCLKITDLDPIPYNLLFSRFLNPERISMPDIDTDFSYIAKDKIIADEVERNGYYNYAKIRTFGTMLAKGVLKDCTRVADQPVSVGVKLSKFITDPKWSLKDAWANNPDLQEYVMSDPQIKKIWDVACKIEGTKKSAGTHACGAINSPRECEEFFPSAVDSETGYLICEYNMNQAEHLGNLKKDLLMLRNLTIIEIAQAAIKERYGITVPLWNEEILNDADALQLFSDGDTNGVFQFESEGMTRFMKQLKPSSFEDIIAGVSLYRPGPMDYIPQYIENKHNPQNIQYSTPKLKPILDDTYGIIVYQEQVMRIVQDLGGFSMGRSDLVRKAMGDESLNRLPAVYRNIRIGMELIR